MIRTFKLSEIHQVVKGHLIGTDCDISNVITDSREAVKNALFVGLKGEKFDGSNFVSAAFEAGAIACVATELSDMSPGIQVVDANEAYGQIAKLNRTEYKGRLIALTGSAGKTTTKEMLAQVLETEGATLKTSSNLNNTIGVPKTLLELKKTHKFAVVEMGANAPGEISYSVTKAMPDLVILLNASEAHTQGFGDLQGVRAAKSEIFEGLQSGGCAVLNKDDQGFDYWQSKINRMHSGQIRLLTFSLLDHSADYFAHDIKLSKTGCAIFRMNKNGKEWGEVVLSIPGMHQVSNALATIASADYLGLSQSNIISALATMKPVAGRIAPLKGILGSVIYDDTYNASPASMKAAIDFMASLDGHRILVLADMAELGEQSEALHEEIANYASAALPDVRFLGATFSRVIRDHSFNDQSELIHSLKADIRPDSRVLIKGAHSMQMDTVVYALAEKELA